jgi:hypothetical protein
VTDLRECSSPPLSFAFLRFFSALGQKSAKIGEICGPSPPPFAWFAYFAVKHGSGTTNSTNPTNPRRVPVEIRITTCSNLVLPRKFRIDGKSLIHKYLALSQSHEATKSWGPFPYRFPSCLCAFVRASLLVAAERSEAALGTSCHSWFRRLPPCPRQRRFGVTFSSAARVVRSEEGLLNHGEHQEHGDRTENTRGRESGTSTGLPPRC